MTSNETERRVILIDPEPDGRLRLAERLRAQGFVVDTVATAAAGAEQALSNPPAAVVADLWMPWISGVQLTRLLGAEAATSDVPVILRAAQDDPRSRFWAERAGAAALVSKGRVGELVRTLHKVTERTVSSDGFFMHLGTDQLDIRDRLAHHLDEALFESVVAAEVRALAATSSFDRLFDSFSQLAARLLPYRWIAVTTEAPRRLAIHHNPGLADVVQSEVVAAFKLETDVEALRIVDDDAAESCQNGNVVVREIKFGSKSIGRIALSSSAAAYTERGSDALISLFARELGGAIEMTALVEQSRRLATTDPLTGLLNRRAFVEVMEVELSRSDRAETPVSVLLFDVDHFKSVNDRFGHRAGDAVLEAIGAHLPRIKRPYDTVARWGGEEFVALLPASDAAGAASAAERFRGELERISVRTVDGQSLSFTVSIGVALRHRGESLEAVLERADLAMYAAKTSGRNRVCVHEDDKVVEQPANVTSIRKSSAA